MLVLRQTKKSEIKTNMKNYIAMIVLLLVMIFITGYFINLNLPYWCFRLEHKEVKGEIRKVEKVTEDEYKITYSFFSETDGKERIRSIRTSLQFSEGDIITVMYNERFLNYVEVKEMGVSPNLFRTLLPVVVPFVCIVFLVLGLFGKVDFNKFS